MKAYIKSFKDFSLIGNHEVTAYTLVDGNRSSVTIYEPDNIDIAQSYNGQWALVDGEVYYIIACQPEATTLTLILQHPIYAFSRPLPYTTNFSTYGALIADGITKGYINGGGDNAYKMPYLSVTNTDATAHTPTVDDYQYYILSNEMVKARAEGVSITFSISGNHSERLVMAVKTANLTEMPIVFGDGHNILVDETYEASNIGKATVVQQQANGSFTTTDYYLSADRHISTTPPANRYEGKWNVYEATAEESTLSVATGAFGGNSASHKIVFTSDKKLEYNQPIKIRLRNKIFYTNISERTLTNDSNLYQYQCGKLTTTLTEKVQSIGSGTYVQAVNGQTGNVLVKEASIEDITSKVTWNDKNPYGAYQACCKHFEGHKEVSITYCSANQAHSVSASTPLFVLPVGYRPSVALYVPFSGKDANGLLAVATNGNVYPITYSASPTGFISSAFTFYI